MNTTTTPSTAPPLPPSSTPEPMYPTFNGTTLDPVITPPNELQAMLQSNAYRIADLVSQLEKSHAQLRRLRTRALKNNSNSSSRIRKSPKPAPKSPRRTRLAPQQTSSPTSIIHRDLNTPATPNRGHWSVEEEAKFDAASLKYGATAYAQITAAVGSRTEKQVRDRAFRQRQKIFKAAEFAALSIPTVASSSSISPVTPPPPSPPQLPTCITPSPVPASVETTATVEEDEDIALSDCSTSTTLSLCLSKHMDSFHSRPTSPLSAVSTVETEFELALLGGKTSPTDMLDAALFQQHDFTRSCEPSSTTTVAPTFDWDCSSPVVMESFCDAVSVPEFADNFLLLEHA